MEKLIDLHTHTIYSDGDKTPKELIALAKQSNISTISITDHDTIEGLKTLTEEDLEGINFINGVELTVNIGKGRMHILGYNIDIYNEKLNMLLANRNDVYNFLLYRDALKDIFNITFSETEINEIINRIGNIGRPDLALLLVKHNYANSIEESFTKYLNKAMDECRSKKRGNTKEICIEMILEAGGIPVLAHPISLKMTKDELYQEILYLKQLGLMGIETRHIHHNPEYTQMLEQIAQDLNLFTTGGTDYHGQIKPHVKLGTGINNNVNVTSSNMVDYLTNLNKQKIKCKKKNITNK